MEFNRPLPGPQPIEPANLGGHDLTEFALVNLNGLRPSFSFPPHGAHVSNTARKTLPNVSSSI